MKGYPDLVPRAIGLADTSTEVWRRFEPQEEHMPNDQGSKSVPNGGETARVQTRARPWSGLLLGLLLGLAVAVILQQAGVWPLDRLLVFGSTGLLGLIGILLAGWGRARGSAF